MDQLLNVQNPTTQQQIEFCRTLRTETVRIIKTSEMVEMLRAIEVNLISVQRWEQSLAQATKLAEKAYPNAGKLNVYTCHQHRHTTVTIDREEGVTSFIISCPVCKTEGRGDVEAYSAMYRVSAGLTPTHEWYKPTEDDLRNLKVVVHPNHFANLMDHVEQGGLLFRKIGEVCNG